MSKRCYDIIVIGGGVAGLTATIALRQAGHNVTLYERQPTIRPLGAGLILWGNAIAAFRELGIEREILDVGRKLGRMTILDTNGVPLSSTDVDSIGGDSSVPATVLHRADLLNVLRSHIPPGVIQTDKRLTRFEQTGPRVVAHFADGVAESGDLLLGADGIWSTVRTQIHGDQRPRYSGYTAWRALTADPSPTTGPSQASETWGRGLRFGRVPLSQERVYWFAAKNAPEGDGADERGHLGELVDLFGDWPSPIPESIRACDDKAILRHDLYDRPPISNWGAGSVTLAGDAAHPMTPNTGQGAAQAIEDAVVLADCLNRYITVDAALRAYESARAPRARMATEIARRIGDIAQIEGRITARLRNLTMRLIPDRLGSRQLRSIVNWNPPALRRPE